MSPLDWQQEMAKKKDELLQRLTEICSIESVLDESTAEPGAPFGKGIAKALDYMLNLGRQEGFQTKNVDGYAGHIEYGEGEELIGVLAHLDVVPPGEGWNSPPFSPEVRNGKFYARGAEDDKGPGMAAFFALKLIQESGLPLSKRVRLIYGTDEESQWRDMDVYFRHEEMPMMGFSPDADFPVIHGEKGLIDLVLRGKLDEPSSEKGVWTLCRFVSGERPNMVPDSVRVWLEGENDVFSFKEHYQEYLLNRRIRGYAEESDDGLILVMEGVSHHGSEPEKGVNAAYAMADFLQQIQLDSQGKRFIGMISDCLVDSFNGEKLGIKQYDERMGTLTVNGGVFRYEGGKEQEVHLNIRYPLLGKSEAIRSQTESVLEPYGLRVTEVDHKEGMYVDPDHPLVSTLIRVYEEQTGDKSQPITIGGATYARALKTGVAYGALFPGSSDTAHQCDEYIDVEELIRAASIYAQAIYELAK